MTLKPAFFSIALSLSLTAGSALAEDQPILPGYWESQNKVSFPINEESTSRRCITAEKVQQFLSGPSTKNFRCTYSRSKVADGAMSAQGECVDKSGLRSTIDVNGTYAPSQFDLKAELVVSLGGLPIPVKASTKATRIGDTCPADGG